ncbi:MAG TPA: DUF3800 domain-containing protein [Fibrobacteria bacterium]|nr:DUF3800 domain-containing protein [Fibrobacteria bacterium]
MREVFHGQLAALMSTLPYRAFLVAVRKDLLVARHGTDAENPYDLALLKGVRSIREWVAVHGGGDVAWIAEARGKREDRQLAATWSILHLVPSEEASPESLEFVPAHDNVAGLQLADLVGYPVARRILNPERLNQAFEVVRTHLCGGQEAGLWTLLP